MIGWIILGVFVGGMLLLMVRGHGHGHGMGCSMGDHQHGQDQNPGEVGKEGQQRSERHGGECH